LTTSVRYNCLKDKVLTTLGHTEIAWKRLMSQFYSWNQSGYIIIVVKSIF